ncbi:MAG: hypothetical protein HW416_703 [Chloroflexi bacterium]|nr:hypothetical protein [Chloroflexota bacterium]
MTREGRSDASYVDRLGEVLRQRDPSALSAFLIDNARSYGGDRRVAEIESQSSDEIEMLMHRMIVARSDLSALHAASRAWLKQRGLKAPSDEPSRRN